MSTFYCIILSVILTIMVWAHLAVAVEYADYIFAEG